MSSDGSRRQRLRGAGALCATLALAGAVLVAAGALEPPLRTPLPPGLLAALLFSAYLFTSRVTLDFELRGNAHSVTIGQLPLALGVLTTNSWLHLSVSVGAALLSALVRREHLLKAGYNVGVAAFEVGGTTLAASLVATTNGGPTPALWAAIFVGLLVTDTLGSVALKAVWWLLGVPVHAAQVIEPLLLGAVVTSAATGIAVVTVSAASVEPWSVPIIGVLAGSLAFAHRRHQQLRSRHATTEHLYGFVRNLGPLDADSDEAVGVLEQVRLLLNAERLELVTPRRTGAWQGLVIGEGQAPQRLHVGPPATASGRPANGTVADPEVMATTLLGSAGLLGVLTARHRLGKVRDFDLGDVRMLETLGAELAMALDRGSLLTDLHRSATIDTLTGLPNLVETTRLVDLLLKESAGRVVVATLAVETFKEVNETLGRTVGDELLLETARRLREAHSDAVVGRIGGARFAVACRRASTDEEEGILFGLRLRSLVEGEVRVGVVGTHIRTSVGLAQGPGDGGEASVLLRRAETAMSSARGTGHGGPLSWAPAYEVLGQRRIAIVTALREAVATGAIGLAFQPKVATKTGAICGVEALARWTHPALGNVSPEEFIPLAEASGLVTPLTSTVLRQAATAARGWQRRAPGVGVAVNVSASTVLDPSFVGEVTDVLRASGLPAHLLTLELTEGVVVSDPELAVERLSDLRAREVRIAIDDFGTGYSSLTYLKGLPIDEVKIDKAFVASLGDDACDTAIVRAVVNIAHTLDVRVVAEGVETVGQQHLLTALGVDETQGWLHARPMSLPAMATWLKARERT